MPTKGGGLCCNFYWTQAGRFDHREIETRADVLCYTSAPLEEDLEVTGPVKVILYAASSAIDTDFTAKLVDVYPCGCAQNLPTVIRARYRASMWQRPHQPGQVECYEIDLWATSNVFAAGHRIRVEISSSNFPRFDRNPNTGHELGADAEMLPAMQTIFHDREHPSRLVLPIVPRKAQLSSPPPPPAPRGRRAGRMRILTRVAVGSSLLLTAHSRIGLSCRAAHWSITCFTSVAMVVAGALAIT